jgi:hypothetical protein
MVNVDISGALLRAARECTRDETIDLTSHGLRGQTGAQVIRLRSGNGSRLSDIASCIRDAFPLVAIHTVQSTVDGSDELVIVSDQGSYLRERGRLCAMKWLRPMLTASNMAFVAAGIVWVVRVYVRSQLSGPESGTA